MAFETLAFEKIKDVGVIKINRPQALNAINVKMLSELDAILDMIDEDRNLRCVILTGSGEKAFIAGADIVEMAAMSAEEARAFAKKGQAVLRRFEIIKVPIIAAVNGYALGGGTELACSCDFIYASQKAKFGQPEVALGLMPGFGGTQRLARFVGLAHARELIYSGRQIGAEEALRVGLVNRVIEPAALMDEALRTAQEIAQKAPLAVAASKEAINDGYDVPIDKGLGFEADLFSDLFETEDMKTGTQAFIDKKPAVFVGE